VSIDWSREVRERLGAALELLVLQINREALYHGDEIALLRNLWALCAR
jgi:hypothetical protein